MRIKYKAEKDERANTEFGFLNNCFKATVIPCFGKVIIKTNGLIEKHKRRKYVFSQKKPGLFFQYLTEKEKLSLGCVVRAMLCRRDDLYPYRLSRQNKIVKIVPPDFLAYQNVVAAFSPTNDKQTALLKEKQQAFKTVFGDDAYNKTSNYYEKSSTSTSATSPESSVSR